MDAPFLVYCEVAGGPLKKQGLVGGFVICVTPRNDIEDAISEARRALTEDGYQLVDIDKAIRFEAEEWAGNDEISSLVKSVIASGELEYSDFDVWGH